MMQSLFKFKPYSFRVNFVSLKSLPVFTYEAEESKKAGSVLGTNFDHFFPARRLFARLFVRLFLLHVGPIGRNRLFRRFVLRRLILRRFVLRRFVLRQGLGHVLVQQVEELVDVLVGDNSVVLVGICKEDSFLII